MVFGENARVLLNLFLINRKQCVRNRLIESHWKIINHGVPQGTVLGPLVFILYVNDFGEEIGKSSIVLQFANDTAILCREKNEQCLKTKSKMILIESEQYMKQNNLALNERKTENIVFKNEKLPTVKCVEFNSHLLKVHCSPLQPILIWQFLVRGYYLKSPPTAARCSPLLHGNFNQE